MNRSDQGLEMVAFSHVFHYITAVHIHIPFRWNVYYATILSVVMVFAYDVQGFECLLTLAPMSPLCQF